jgi:hypothetical protein
MMNEQHRMESFYLSLMPRTEMLWKKDDRGEYFDDFAQLAWAAWQAAQYAYAGAPLVTEIVKQLELEFGDGQGNS